MSVSLNKGTEEFKLAVDAFLAALQNQVAVEQTSQPTPVDLPPRGVREFVNKFVKLWKFTARWRSNIFAAMPASIQAVMLAIDLVILLISEQNAPGPE